MLEHFYLFNIINTEEFYVLDLAVMTSGIRNTLNKFLNISRNMTLASLPCLINKPVVGNLKLKCMQIGLACGYDWYW